MNTTETLVRPHTFGLDSDMLVNMLISLTDYRQRQKPFLDSYPKLNRIPNFYLTPTISNLELRSVTL